VTETESEWDEEERAWPLALADVEAGECPGCGHQLADTLHVDGKPDPIWQVSYEACTRCAELERVQRIQSEADEKQEKRTAAYDYPSARRWMARQVNKTTE